ncbi:hypothetical protein [Streptomyces javensis]|uniref:Uncharacterized protein n=1 Tax=Streptomyces javensis TaxID=114698 RepID=A0ABS0R5M8_9ACTN|nr:hypothetical protein [Streptomyces javensis]MBI0312701.1 hypothetical protein [Streptomyces javensis]
MTTGEDDAPDNVIPFRRRPATPAKRGRQCICGAYWKPGHSSDPAWLLNTDPLWDSFHGVTHCQACGRHKLSVIFGRDMRPASNFVNERNT